MQLKTLSLIREKAIEYFLTIYYPIYCQNTTEQKIESKQMLADIIEGITITNTSSYSLDDTIISYYDSIHNIIYVCNQYSDDISTYIHEYTHAIDPTDVFKCSNDKFALTEAQEDLLYSIYKTDQMQKTYDTKYNLTGIFLQKMIVREARAENNELRYILYTEFTASDYATFADYIEHLTNADFEQIASQLGYHTKDRWRLADNSYDDEKIKNAKLAILSIA